MHRRFAGWLSEKLWRAGLFSVIFGVMSWPFTVMAGAVPILITMRRDARAGLQVALIGSAGIAATMVSLGRPLDFTALWVTAVLLVPWTLAVILKRTGSMNLCFQVAVLVSGLLLCVLYAALEDPVRYWQDLLREAVRAMNSTGLILDEKAVLQSLAVFNWGTYVSLWLLTVLSSLFLGRWWQSLLEAPGEFGAEFRQVRTGKLVGGLALGIMIVMLLPASWRMNWPLMSALAWPAVIALAFQGLAAVHKLKAAGRIGRGWLIAVYVLLLVPISMVVTVIALAGWGLADNWQRTRANAN